MAIGFTSVVHAIAFVAALATAKKNFRLFKDSYANYQWTIEANGIQMRMGDNLVYPKWIELKSVRVSKGILFVRHKCGIEYFLPIRAVPSSLDSGELVGFIQSKLG